jgi:thioredoxin-dependent peroxiredoxin
MISKNVQIFLTGLFLVLIMACATGQPKMIMESLSALPGGQVTFAEKPLHLIGSPIAMGRPLPSVKLTDAMTMEDVDLSTLRGSVLFLSIVPSLDTPVCEAQTHYLGEKGTRMPPSIKRITISRDTPFAQKRFATEAKLTKIQYLSDYKEGAFGRSTGLLIDGLMLDARTVILVDTQGIVRYIQVVPELTHLPDMEKAFDVAIELSKKA